jgi:hypothetical protein
MGESIRDCPILFSGPMVRSILNGRKSQTRRVMKPQPKARTIAVHMIENHCLDGSRYWADAMDVGRGYATQFWHSRYGRAKDRLWVRETWQQVIQRKRDGEWFIKPTPTNGVGEIVYAADHKEEPPRWRSSIVMPRWASRLTLEITEVRVERLQDINPGDCIAEGIQRDGLDPDNIGQYWREEAVAAYEELWNSINGKKYPWDSNPFVWVIAFRRLV